MPAHFFPLRINDIKAETPSCISISFEVPADIKEYFKFTQGQSLTLRKVINGEEIRRSYSICSSPLDNELRIAVKKIGSGIFSTHAHEQFKKGDILESLPPSGRFYTSLDINQQKNYTAFAAGSGITPLLSIIKTTLATEPLSQFTLIYGNQNRISIIFREELEALKNRYMDRFSIIHILSREETESPLNHGRINKEKCREMDGKLVDLQNTHDFFICGPEKMLFAVKEYLEDKGITPDRIHMELFSVPGQIHSLENQLIAGPDGNCEVTIKSDGISFHFNLSMQGENILDAALKQGADLPYSCKGGVCCTCRARLLKGRVKMDANYSLEKEELEAGYILTCQSHPLTEKIMIDYDT